MESLVEKIRNKSEKAGISVVFGEMYGDALSCVKISQQPQVIDDLLNIASTVGNKRVFLDITFMDNARRQNSLIDLESITETEYGPFMQSLIKKAKGHNQVIECVPLGSIIQVGLFTVGQGVYYLSEFNHERHDVLFTSGVSILDSIAEDYEEGIVQYQANIDAEVRVEFTAWQESVEPTILGDPLFRQCTTKASRQRYLSKVVSRPDRPVLEISRKEIEEWADFLWAQVKTESKITGS